MTGPEVAEPGRSHADAAFPRLHQKPLDDQADSLRVRWRQVERSPGGDPKHVRATGRAAIGGGNRVKLRWRTIGVRAR